MLFSDQKQRQNKTFGDDQFKFKFIVCKIVRELKVSTKRALIPDEFLCLLSENAIANIIPFCTYKCLSDALPELGLLGDYAKSINHAGSNDSTSAPIYQLFMTFKIQFTLYIFYNKMF